MSPIYMGKEVSDEDLQELLASYRSGQSAVGANVEDGDQPIIDRLEEVGITKPLGANIVGRHDGRAQAQ